MTVRVGILETGFPSAALREQSGTYGDMVARMLGPDAICVPFDVTRGMFPAADDVYDAFLITGSAAGVHDDLPWIAQLATFLREMRGKARLVGLCFGHQVMAHAFGGTVARSPDGWGMGLHDYAITAPEAWMAETAAVAIPVMHQDQVVTPPPEARVVGGSAFTPHAILAYGDDALSFQCHPEFEPAYVASLIELRRHLLPDQVTADAFIASLDRDNDRAVMGRWIRDFVGGGKQPS